MKVTVAICTSGRDTLVHAVRSLAKQLRPADELVIVDQSKRGTAQKAIDDAGYPFPYRVVENNERGLSKARNAAVAAITEGWVFFTDDDCVASLDLVDQFHKVIAAYPDCSFFSGTCVRPLDYDPVTQDVPGVYVGKQVPIDEETVMLDGEFMGACLAFRKDLLDKVGKFDEFLGAGMEWPAGEECDYVFRAICAGFKGRTNARLLIFHEYGARTRPADDTDNGRIGNAVVIWKMKQIGDPLGIKIAQRICPYGPKKVMLAKLTFGAKFPVDLKMYNKVQELNKRLDREFKVEKGVLVKK
ncbi:MAG: hypothetical protein BGO01_07050 [Armatimonadetes bacterium 55-13]|nr:glycosyltransferase family 2 protein [Armatimonadota bacterium]ODU51875.1 MAG: hypothetical protein ABT09_03290 [bacterium SCN 57-13]OJU62257.1 MAG: hypothetical protein BGO01_07050 [Armatimonadetes bacterium 55-13]